MAIEIGLKTLLSSFDTTFKLTGKLGYLGTGYFESYLNVRERKKRVKWTIQTYLDKWLVPSDRLLCTNID